MSKSKAGNPTVHFFGLEGGGKPPGRNTLGDKGWHLAQLGTLGAPLAPGFILGTDWSEQVHGNGGRLPEALQSELSAALEKLQETAGGTFGNDKDPLLLSVRSSPPQPMPGSMGAVFNVGLTAAATKAMAGGKGDGRAAWDAYRRLLESYAVQALGADADAFETPLNAALEEAGAEADHELSAEAMQALAERYEALCRELAGNRWPGDAHAQLRGAVEAAIGAWYGDKAEDYRAEHNLEHLPGTGVVVQAMFAGTGADGSGAGRFYTRVPANGEKKLHGHFLPSALGPDLSAGIRMTDTVASLEKSQPELFAQLTDWAGKAERHFHDALELQFGLRGGELRFLAAKPASRTPRASMQIALDLVAEGVCTDREALRGVDPNFIEEFLHPVLDKASHPRPVCKGLAASPGSAVGQVVFFAEHAVELNAQGIKTILVRHETSPEDLDGLRVAQGIVTELGGLTSHAAVVARGMGKPCVVGASDININYHINEMTIGEHTVRRLDWMSIDGNTGEIYLGELPQKEPELEGGAATVLEWADKHRRLGVYANADTGDDARRAVEMGAGGIGLCRTEHMFFEFDRIPLFRKMILSTDIEGRQAALSELQPLQRGDFMDLFRAMDGKPVTIRLLDPPLNEFLPKGVRSQNRMAKAMNIPVERVTRRTEQLSEANPMMGHRGCRLAITYPEIYIMQTRAIVEAACIVKKEGVNVHPEIMIPLVSTVRELIVIRREIEATVLQVIAELGESIPFRIGTMLETPRAAVTSHAIARHADFFSFGTNDLTQMAYGFSRDDAGRFLPQYLDRGVLERDPFVQLDQEGVGELVAMACEQGRRTNAEITLGICGEHGGEPNSVAFCHRVGLDYVSCSPFRVPVARLAAGVAAVRDTPDA